MLSYPKELFLEVSSPNDNLVVRSNEIPFAGRASPDATVSINGHLVELDPSGEFETTVSLPPVEGPNLLEVIASDLAGDVKTEVRTVVFTPSMNGVFGRVVLATPAAQGGTTLNLVSPEGDLLTLDAAQTATVIIPGRARASAEDISKGDFLAALVDTSGGGPEALSILVKPERPVSYAHVTGAMLGSSQDQAIVMDANGNQITADLLPGAKVLLLAQVATALVHQDVRTGRLSISGVEFPDVKIQRLRSTLEVSVRRGATGNEANLKDRLRANVTGHLSTLQRVTYRIRPEIQPSFRQFLESTRQGYEEVLDAFDIGPPALKLTGTIEDVDQANNILFIGQREGPLVPLLLTEATEIREFGEDAHPGNLSSGQTIVSIYDPLPKKALSIDVIFPTLDERLIEGLLVQGGIGELEGSITDVDTSTSPPRVSIRTASGETVSLAITAKTSIEIGDTPSTIGNLVRGLPVKARYDPDTNEALDLQAFQLRPGFAIISGTVKSIVPKYIPGNRMPGRTVDGNIEIVSLKGESLVLIASESTVIEKDGSGVNTAAIRLGDLVRPISRYNTQNRHIMKLVLKPARLPLQGTVRGKYTSPLGTDFLTVSTDELDLVTIQVSGATDITSQGKVATFVELEVGDRVETGLYEPVQLIASQLAVQPPNVPRTAGTILALDPQFSVVTISPAQGPRLELRVLDKPGVITRDGAPAAFDDLEVGDKVLAAYYQPNKAIVQMEIYSG